MSTQALKTKATNNNASHSVFGWDFQRNAAIILMLEHIKDAEKIKVEGKTEDIEITLNNGKVIYSQAKSSERPHSDSNIMVKLKKALKTLNDASNVGDHENLVFITNSPNPFNDEKTMSQFVGRTKLNYSELHAICQEKIQKIIENEKYNIDTDNLKVYIVPFEGEDRDNRYKIIKEAVSDFMSDANLTNDYNSKQILKLWQEDFFFNSTIKDPNIQITKKEMIWGLITCVCNFNNSHKFLQDYDESVISEIEKNYKYIINNKTEEFEFIAKILADYNSFASTSTEKEKRINFIDQKYTNYIEEFSIDSIEEEIKEILVKTILHKVLDKKFVIGRVKKGANL